MSQYGNYKSDFMKEQLKKEAEEKLAKKTKQLNDKKDIKK